MSKSIILLAKVASALMVFGVSGMVRGELSEALVEPSSDCPKRVLPAKRGRKRNRSHCASRNDRIRPAFSLAR
jgi:hypothetical protein